MNRSVLCDIYTIVVWRRSRISAGTWWCGKVMAGMTGGKVFNTLFGGLEFTYEDTSSVWIAFRVRLWIDGFASPLGWRRCWMCGRVSSRRVQTVFRGPVETALVWRDWTVGSYSSGGRVLLERKGEIEGRNLDWRVFLIRRGPESDEAMW